MVNATLQKPIEKAREKTREMLEREKQMAKDLSDRMDRHSPSIITGLTLGSIIYSLVLFFRKSKESAIFVGLWAPTILTLGLFWLLVKGKRE